MLLSIFFDLVSRGLANGVYVFLSRFSSILEDVGPDFCRWAHAPWLKPEYRDELLEVPLAPAHHEGLPIPAHVEGIVHAVYERHDGLILAPELRIGTDDSANLKDEDGCQGIAKGVPIVIRDERRRNRQHPRNDGPRLDESANCGPEGYGASSCL